MKSEEFIKSFVRVKPISQDESAVVWCSESEVHIAKTKEFFPFNKVFNSNTQNDAIYDIAISPIISDLLKGYNACVLAYGQTSSGKTFTMKGVGHSLGLIPLSIKQIFGRIQQKGLMAKVKISYFQIYNQNIIDLLMNDQQVRYLQLREDGRKNLIVMDLIEQEVRDEFEALSHYQRGELKRKFASNTINFASSRSHTIFKVTLSNVTDDSLLVESSIYMVDLAGSESISKTNAVGVLKKEAENINKSLLALTTVIRAISERQAYINYRNSKLTRILQPCLSGNSKTIVICTVKQTEDCLAETVNTLKFGVSANSIRTDARQNVVEPSEKDDGRYQQLKKILQEERNEKAYLQAELVRRNGELETSKMDLQRVEAELNDCKHRLFALENQNRHHTGLINFYRNEQEKENNTRNIFFEKSQESIALIEDQNKNLKITIGSLNQTIEKRNKKIVVLEKNQRTLLDKIEKYEEQLQKLQQMAGPGQKLQENPVNNRLSTSNDPSRVEMQKKSNKQVNGPQKGRSQRLISSALTIGTVISLSTTILRMKIDMNHYLTTIAELHNQISELQAKIDSLKKNEGVGSRSQETSRRQSGARSKQDDKKMRKMEHRVQQLKQENARLQKKNSHYMKILKKCANNNIDSIVGFNDYIEKNFKYNEKALFEELMQESAEDALPYNPYEKKPRDTRQEKNQSRERENNSNEQTR